MKRDVMLATLLALTISSILLLPVYSIRPNYIYDNAGIIDNTHKELITNYLIELDENTTAEIVIYTIESLEGKTIEEKADEIFNHTPLDGVVGIGKKDKDNGILILIAVEDRKWRIEVGYGLEGIINDAKAGRIGREYLTTYFKQGKYGEGLYKAVQALGEEIIKGPTEDEPLKVDPAVVQMLVFVLLGVFLVIIWIILIFKVIKPAIKWNRERKRKNALREQLRSKIQELENKIEEYSKGIDSLDDDIQHLPQWAKDEIKSQMEAAYFNLKQIKRYFFLAKRALKKYPDESKHFLDFVKTYGHYIDAALDEVLVGLPQKMEEYKRKAPQKIRRAKLRVKKTEKFLKELEERGFKVQMWLDSLEEVKKSLETIQKAYKNTILDFRPICESADKALAKTEKISIFSHKMLKIHGEASSILNRLPTSIQTIRNSLTSGSASLKKLKSETSKRVWTQIEYNFLKIPSLLEMAEDYLKEAEELNSISVQKFDQALEECNKALKIVEKANTYLINVEKKRKEIKDSKEKIPALLKRAERDVKAAANIVNNSDVKSYPRKLAGEAKEKLRDGKDLMTGKDLVDWLLVMAILNQSIHLAKLAKEKAKEDIEEAEEAREEERRRRERERYWSSSSGYGSSGSSGGFGGGFSGGGGASGGW